MKRTTPTLRQPAPRIAHVVTSAALAAGGDGAGGLPTRMRILAWGENPNSQGVRVHVGQKLAAALASPTYPFKQVALDYEHSTWPGSQAYKETREPREVAAFLSVELREGEGVFANVDRWTPSGLKNATNFCDLSATPLLDKEGNVTAIVSVALSRAGAVPGVEFTQAALAAIQTYQEGDGMNWRDMICEALGLDASSTDEELKDALDKHFKAAKAGGGEAALNAAGVAGIVGAAVKAHASPLAARLDAMEKRAICDGAKAEGKVVALSDNLLAKLTCEELRAHVAGLPVAVPLSALTPVTVAEGKTVALSATELQVCQSLGITPEAYAKEKGGAK